MTLLRSTLGTCLLVVLAVSAPGQTLVPDPGEAAQTRDVAYWRGRIDDVDRKIVGLLNDRAGYVAQLIPLKEQAGQAVRDPKREEEVLAKVRALSDGPLPDESITRIYEAIMTEMRRLQEKSAAGSDR